MSALKAPRWSMGVLRKFGAYDRLSGGDGLVLPRWLRRPARWFARLGSGELTPPRFANFTLNAVLVTSAAAYGAYVGGRMPEVVQAVTARTGFAVDQIKVVGNRETSEIDVLERLQLDGWTSLIGMNADEARDRIAALPWVSNVSVRKTYPDAIEVRLDERTPFAIWQDNGQLAVIEASGRVIAPFDGGRLGRLPLVVGEGAEKTAAAFIAKVRAFPEIASHAKVFMRVADRRWDMRLDNGMVVKLPEFGEDEALARLETMNRDAGLLSRDLKVVDMRLSDRVVVQLTPEAAERREASLKDKPKAIKAKAEKRI